MTHGLKTRNVTIGRRRTSMRLEPEFWDALDDIAGRERTNVNALCTRIAEGRWGSNLTSQVRVYIAGYYRRLGGCLPLFVPGRGGAIDDHMKLIRRRSEVVEGAEYDRRVLWQDETLLRSRPTGMLIAFHQWRELKALYGRAPLLEELLSGPAGAELCAGRANLVDVTATDPADFLFERFNAVSQQWYGVRGGLRVRDLPHPLLPPALEQEFRDVKESRLPKLHSITQRLAGCERVFVRLSLPAVDAAGSVCRLLTVIRGMRTDPPLDAEPVAALRLPPPADIASLH